MVGVSVRCWPCAVASAVSAVCWACGACGACSVCCTCSDVQSCIAAAGSAWACSVSAWARARHRAVLAGHGSTSPLALALASLPSSPPRVHAWRSSRVAGACVVPCMRGLAALAGGRVAPPEPRRSTGRQAGRQAGQRQAVQCRAVQRSAAQNSQRNGDRPHACGLRQRRATGHGRRRPPSPRRRSVLWAACEGGPWLRGAWTG